MKGRHYQNCIEKFPDCPCNTCAKDNAGLPGEIADTPCCMRHNKPCGGIKCPDYVKEDDNDDS